MDLYGVSTADMIAWTVKKIEIAKAAIVEMELLQIDEQSIPEIELKQEALEDLNHNLDMAKAIFVILNRIQTAGGTVYFGDNRRLKRQYKAYMLRWNRYVASKTESNDG